LASRDLCENPLIRTVIAVLLYNSSIIAAFLIGVYVVDLYVLFLPLLITITVVLYQTVALSTRTTDIPWGRKLRSIMALHLAPCLLNTVVVTVRKRIDSLRVSVRST